jgi:hypothetical protein
MVDGFLPIVVAGRRGVLPARDRMSTSSHV